MTKENEIQENQNDNDSINIEELFNQDFNPSILNRIGEKDELESTSIYTTVMLFSYVVWNEIEQRDGRG